MAKQRVVNTYFWSDDFILDLKADEKLMFLYVLTNPQTDLCGAYQIAMRKMVFETGLQEKRIRSILDLFEKAGKISYRDGWMIVKNFAKHQVNNPKVALGIERSLKNCPDWVKDTLTIGFDRLSKGVTLLPELLPEPEPSDSSAAANMTDSEWLQSLTKNPAYKNLLVETEYEKAKVWATTNNRQPTRRFFVNWLNRARPMDIKTNGNGRPHDPGKREDTPYVPPPPCRFCGSDVCLKLHEEEIRAEAA